MGISLSNTLWYTNNYGKSPFLMGQSTISMAMFHSFLLVYQAGYIGDQVDQVIFIATRVVFFFQLDIIQPLWLLFNKTIHNGCIVAIHKNEMLDQGCHSFCELFS